MKSLQLIRAMFSEGMNIFAYRTKTAQGATRQAILPLILAGVVMYSSGSLAYALIAPLQESGQAAIVPLLLIILLSVVGLTEGIYKSSSLLFECRDNDLLLSLPIPKSRIFALRVLKLIVFQIIFNALFMLPAFAVYAVLVQPAPSFYPISILMLFLTPLIPTALAVVIGYIVKALSLGFQRAKLSQTILTFVAILVMLLILGNWQSLVVLFSDRVASIAEVAGRIYYPAGAYARLIQQFSWFDLLGLIASCVVPLIVIIYLCSIKYFRVIAKSSAITVTKSTPFSQLKISHSSKLVALVKKELSRVLSSPVFMVNTLFGPVLLLFVTLVASINTDVLLGFFGDDGGEVATISATDIGLLAPLFYIGALIVMCAMTSITSSMISLEGRSLNIVKSLPVTSRQILLAKLLASLVLALPLFLLSDFCFIFAFHPSLQYSLLVVILPFLALTLSGLIGLLVNLKYPKMNATSDAEVVKQSASSLTAVFIGMGVGVGSATILVALSIFTSLDAPLIVAAIYLCLDFCLLRVLGTWGARKLRRIEI